VRVELNPRELVIIYGKREWEQLERLYVKAGLEKYTTNHFLGKYTMPVYRYRDEYQHVFPLASFHISINGETYTVETNDDINLKYIVRPDGFRRYLVNLAVFRVIPICGEKECRTTIPIDEASMMVAPYPAITLIIILNAFKYALSQLLQKTVRIRYYLTASIEL